MNKPTHDKIYLVPEDGIYCWSTTPAPVAQHESNDAVEYVRGDLFETMKAERDALSAQVEVLGDKLSEVVDLLDVDGMTAIRWLLDNCQEIEAITDIEPQQHLAEIRAEAGRAGFVAGFEKARLVYCCEAGYCKTMLDEYADQYAATVRKGGAE